MLKLMNEFKQFLLRGNVVDLAVAVVIGAAFSSVVNALVEDLITPLIAAIGGEPDFSGLVLTLNGSAFHYGDFLNKVVSFAIISAVIFFFIVKPINLLIVRTMGENALTKTKECPYCCSQIPVAATRCAFCTAELPEPRRSAGLTS